MLRLAKVNIDEVVPFVFTKKVRASLKEKGLSYHSMEWVTSSKREFLVNGEKISIPMGSHRYQLFAEKGIECVKCGIKGVYFAIERNANNNPNKYHLNLYGFDKSGKEIMITKDHIVPRSKGGKNIISNYQTMCFECNNNKGNL